MYKLLFIFSGERILLRPSAIDQFVGTEADNNLALGIDVKVKLGCLHILQITGIILLCLNLFCKRALDLGERSGLGDRSEFGDLFSLAYSTAPDGSAMNSSLYFLSCLLIDFTVLDDPDKTTRL